MKGQTAKAVEAFLRKEGWKKCKGYYKALGVACAGWKSPQGICWHLKEAYRLALRRKAQRERAALKRAGFSFSKVYGLWECRNEWLYTKEKALEIVEGSQGTPRRGK